MNSSTKLLLAGCCLACAPAFASLTFVSASGGLGSNDSTTWGQVGADATALPGGFSATSGLLIGVTGGFSATDNTGLVADVCPDVPSCSWTGGPGMNAGDVDIWAFDPSADAGNGGGTGPLTISFGTALIGAGAYIEGDTSGAFTATIQAFNGGTSLGAASSLTSDGSGDPIFLGLVNIGPATANITSIVFNLTSCAGCTDPSLPDFAIDTLLMTDAIVVGTTPEPSSMLLLGSGLAGMAWILRKRSLRNDQRS